MLIALIQFQVVVLEVVENWNMLAKLVYLQFSSRSNKKVYILLLSHCAWFSYQWAMAVKTSKINIEG